MGACGLCNAIRGYWKSWNPVEHDDIGDICSNGRAPCGNGGFSFRSRKWMNKVIQTCPSKYVTKNINIECNVQQDIAEDIYFATALLGLKNVPLPTSIESALFAAETKFLDGVMSEYHNTNANHLNNNVLLAVSRRWGHGNDSIHAFIKMKEELGFIIPIGMHKPWRYHTFDILLHEKMKDYCPFFEKISHVD